MINECSRALLQDKIVESAAEVDLAMIMGTGFPPFRGGLLRYADKVGIETISKKLEDFAKSYPRLRPSPQLLELIKSGRSFYSA